MGGTLLDYHSDKKQLVRNSNTTRAPFQSNRIKELIKVAEGAWSPTSHRYFGLTHHRAVVEILCCAEYAPVPTGTEHVLLAMLRSLRRGWFVVDNQLLNEAWNRKRRAHERSLMANAVERGRADVTNPLTQFHSSCFFFRRKLRDQPSLAHSDTFRQSVGEVCAQRHVAAEMVSRHGEYLNALKNLAHVAKGISERRKQVGSNSDRKLSATPDNNETSSVDLNTDATTATGDDSSRNEGSQGYEPIDVLLAEKLFGELVEQSAKYYGQTHSHVDAAKLDLAAVLLIKDQYTKAVNWWTMCGHDGRHQSH